MTFHRLATLARRAGAFTLCSVMLFASVAAAAPSESTTSTPRKPATTGSEIDVTLDPKTEEFRKELASRQSDLDKFQAELDQLDRELELATEEYNKAVDRLTEMKQRVELVEGDLAKANSAYELQTEILGTRAASIYRDGSMATFEVLLDSQSVGDFVARMKFLNTIGILDADIAASLKGQKALLDSQAKQLQSAKQTAESLEFELKARQIEIMLRIQERQTKLNNAQKDLLELLDQESSRRSAEERALLADIFSGANAKGIVVEPGSPVETALAYHGVPYLWGGETPRGLDCSGLMLYVFRQHGVNLPHYSGSQFGMGEKVSASELEPGDAVFFGSPVHHVGMYMGGGYYIHAPRTGDFVKISKLSGRRDFAGARRYSWTYRTEPPVNAVNSAAKVLGNTSL